MKNKSVLYRTVASCLFFGGLFAVVLAIMWRPVLERYWRIPSTLIWYVLIHILKILFHICLKSILQFYIFYILPCIWQVLLHIWYILPHIWYILPIIWYILPHIWYILHHIWYILPHIWNILPHIWYILPHIWYIQPHISYILTHI